MAKVGAVVLAAGQSSRFRAAGGSAETKLVETLGDKPIVRMAAFDLNCPKSELRYQRIDYDTWGVVG